MRYDDGSADRHKVRRDHITSPYPAFSLERDKDIASDWFGFYEGNRTLTGVALIGK